MIFFYSPILNSCLYKVAYYRDMDWDWVYLDLMAEKVFDGLTNKYVLSDYDDDEMEANENFEQQIKELKGE